MASAAPTWTHSYACDTILYRLLHLFEGVHLDLAHALARHAVLVGEFIECDRLVGKAPPLEDAALALVQHCERLAQGLAAIVSFLTLGELRLLACALIDQPATRQIRPPRQWGN